MTGSSAGAGVIVTARVTPQHDRITCGGPANVCAQHCMPQPAAQGQPLSWPAGDVRAAVRDAAAHRLVAKGLAAAIDSGNSKACSATT